MRAGRLNRRITIQNYTTTQDANGNIVQTWTTFATVWAAVEPASGREFFEAQQIATETTVKFVIRHRSGITEDMRIKDEDGNLFDIQSVLHIKYGNRQIEIMAIRTNEESA